MTRDEMIAQLTLLLDRSYEAGCDSSYEAGWDEGYREGYRRGLEDQNA